MLYIFEFFANNARMSDLPPVLGVQIEVIEKEGLRVPKVTLNNQTFRTEAGAMYYI